MISYLIQKIHLHECALVKAPPSTGPRTPAMEMTDPMIGPIIGLRCPGATSGNMIIVTEKLYIPVRPQSAPAILVVKARKLTGQNPQFPETSDRRAEWSYLMKSHSRGKRRKRGQKLQERHFSALQCRLCVQRRRNIQRKPKYRPRRPSWHVLILGNQNRS